MNSTDILDLIPSDSMSTDYIKSGVIIKIIINIIVIALLVCFIIFVVKRKKKISVALIITAIILAICSMLIPYVKYRGGFAGVDETDSLLLSRSNWSDTTSFREKEYFIEGFGKMGIDIFLCYWLAYVIRVLKERSRNKKANEKIKVKSQNKKVEKK